MYDKNKFLEQEKIVEDIFYDFFKSKGYFTRINDDIKNIGYGGIAVADDKFALIFELHGFPYPKSFSVSAEDRNGNFVVMGETVAIYSIIPDDNISKSELEEKFKTLLNDIYSKYKVYSKENRLDFVYKNMELERKEYKFGIEKNMENMEEELEKWT